MGRYYCSTHVDCSPESYDETDKINFSFPRSTSPRSVSRSPARSSSRSPGRSPARRLDETDEAQLERLYKPVFVMKPTSIRCSEGQTARFDLKVVGRPMPDTYWFFNGERKQDIVLNSSLSGVIINLRHFLLQDNKWSVTTHTR